MITNLKVRLHVPIGLNRDVSVIRTNTTHLLITTNKLPDTIPKYLTTHNNEHYTLITKADNL